MFKAPLCLHALLHNMVRWDAPSRAKGGGDARTLSTKATRPFSADSNPNRSGEYLIQPEVWQPKVLTLFQRRPMHSKRDATMENVILEMQQLTSHFLPLKFAIPCKDFLLHLTQIWETL